jgi:hypothetical protein
MVVVEQVAVAMLEEALHSTISPAVLELLTQAVVVAVLTTLRLLD